MSDILGKFNANVTNVELIEHRFQEQNVGQVEIRIDFLTQNVIDGKTIEVKGSCYKDLSTTKWIDKGPDKGKRACDATLDTLAKLGIDARSNPYNISKLIGRELAFNGHQTDKYGVNYYLDTFEDKKADESLLRNVFAEITNGFGSQATAPVQAPAMPVQAIQQPAPAQQAVQQQPAPVQQASAPDMTQFLKQAPAPVAPVAGAAPQGWV